jgi:hypothetical protein
MASRWIARPFATFATHRLGEEGVHEIHTSEDSCSRRYLRRCYRGDERFEHMAWYRTGCIVTLTRLKRIQRLTLTP